MQWIYKKFFSALGWNTLELILTQGLVVIDHAIMRSQCGSSLHGVIATLFSLVYSGTTVINVGFDLSLAPFFTTYTKSRQAFRLFLRQYIPLQLIMSLIMLGLIYSLQNTIFSGSRYQDLLGTHHTLILYSLIFCESIRKTMRMLLHLAFLNMQTSLLEIFSTASYMLVFWTRCFLGYPITLEFVFGSLLIVSIGQSMLLAFFIYTWYLDLPLSANQRSEVGQKRMLYNRLINYLSQLTDLIFSANVIIPLVGYASGFEAASSIKIIMNLVQFVTTLIQKVLGISANALLAQAKESSLKVQRFLFEQVSEGLAIVLTSTLILALINLSHIMFFVSFDSSGLLLIMLFLSAFETFFVLYQKWYLNQEALVYFLTAHITGIFIIFALYLLLSATLSLMLLLSIMTAVRLGILITVMYYAWHRWGIRPYLKIRPDILLYATLTAAALSGILYIIRSYI